MIESIDSDSISPNAVFLISADIPGCGSSTLAEGLGAELEQLTGSAVFVCSIGKLLRDALGVTTEADLHEKLSEIDDPHDYDSRIYNDMLPPDQICVVDGKLATTAGPQYLAEDRQIFTIDLTTPPLFSAKRVLQREGGKSVSELFSDEPDASIIEHLEKVLRRAQHDDGLRIKLTGENDDSSGADPRPAGGSIRIDTSTKNAKELLAAITGDRSHESQAPAWEVEALKNTLKTLMSLGVDLRDRMHPQDRVHFEHQLEAITYGIDRLGITKNSLGLQVIREDLKKAIIDCWYGLMLKRIPRFFKDSNNQSDANENIVFDTESHSWSPEFYKIAEGWPTLSALLKDKVVLDPFAGSGTLMNLLVARGIPSRAIYSDMSFMGGKPLNQKGYWYDPHLNTQASQLLFDDLPSWYKPDFGGVDGYITADGLSLPLKDDSVDYIFADPPYGKNLDGAGIGLLFGCLEEFNRVAAEGSILLVPLTWLKEITASRKEVVQLTGDVSNGKSGFPVCYILVKNPSSES